MKKLDMEIVKTNANYWKKKDIPAMQIAVYVMCGGGMLGRMAAEQPADFYIDDRVGRLPYPKREIEQAVQVLATIAKAKRMDTHNMTMPRIHNLGVF